jgi:hypothetical protein
MIKLIDILNELNNITENYDQNIIKELFKDNSELVSIGTPEQYAEYLNTIFPNSKVKDIVYRGDRFKYDAPKDLKIGIYFTLNKRYAQQYSGNITLALIDTNEPLYISENPQYYWNRIIDKTDRLSNYDSIIYNKGEEIIVSSQQVYVLGSKQDIEEFKKYTEKNIKKEISEDIHDPVKPGILKKRLGKLSCSKVKKAKGKLKNKGTHYAKALQRYINYHC